MRKPTKCRSCNLNYDLSGRTGRHRLVDASLYCPLCFYSGRSVYHGEHDELSGHTLECGGCHNYILYFDNGGAIDKDEIYLDNYCLIRYPVEAKSYYLINDKTAHIFPYVIQFNNKEDLLNKLKLAILFS